MATAGLGKLVRPATFSDDAVLAIDRSTSEEFEARLSDFADALDRIQVDASLLTDEQTKLYSSLNRFSDFSPLRMVSTPWQLRMPLGRFRGTSA